MTVALLVRHAVTAATGDRLGGWTSGVDLSEEGREQARGVADRLAGLDIAAVHASPLERTQQTAAIIAASHDLDVVTTEGVGEVDYGDWTDRPLEELREEELWPVIQRTPSRVAFPGGETIRAAQARAVDAVETIAADHDEGAVVLVSHADIIKSLVAHFLGMHLDVFQRIVIAPASVTAVGLRGGAPPVLLRCNDTGPITLPEPPS